MLERVIGFGRSVTSTTGTASQSTLAPPQQSSAYSPSWASQSFDKPDYPATARTAVPLLHNLAGKWTVSSSAADYWARSGTSAWTSYSTTADFFSPANNGTGQPQQQGGILLATSATSSTFPGQDNNSFGSSSAPKHRVIREEHRNLLGYRAICEDRRGPLDHLQPGALIRNCIRVTVQQGTLIYSHYMSDQLKHDLARDEKVQRGELTSTEAEVQADEWREKEWDKRWKAFPERLLTAYLKYHAVTAIMRFYEFMASRSMSLIQLDKLTLDPFAAARRRQKRGETISPNEVARECWDANFIAYLSDYSLHQIILAFSYYVYVRNYYKKRKSGRRQEQQAQRPSSQQSSQSAENSDDWHMGSLALSFLKKSTILAVSRVIGLAFASIGGAVGSVLIPGGWGVLMGINMGDSVGLQMTEEFVSNSDGGGSTSGP
ncbi:hypothetical protein ACA910_005759 [Epithemia clementina (nom. ined.)]